MTFQAFDYEQKKLLATKGEFVSLSLKQDWIVSFCPRECDFKL